MVTEHDADRFPSVAPLLWRASAVQLGIATQLIVDPLLFASPAYAAIAGWFGVVSALLVAGGTLSVLSLAGVVPRRLVPAAMLVAAAPLVFLAYGFVFSGVVTGSVGWTVEVVALLYGAGVLWTGRAPAGRVYVLMVGAMQTLHAAGMIVAPAQFQNRANYAEFGSFLWLFIPSFLVAGLGILACELTRRPRALIAFSALATVNLAVLANVFAVTHIWSGVLSYSVMAVVLLIAVQPRGLRSTGVLLGAIAAAVGVWDLVAWVLPVIGTQGLVPAWALMRPSSAIAFTFVAAGYAIALRPMSGGPRRLAATLGVLGALLAALTTWVNAALTHDPSAVGRLLIGQAPGEMFVGAFGGTLLVTIAGVLLAALVRWPEARVLPHLVAGTFAVALGMAVLNLLAYMLDQSELLDVYGAASLRLHLAIGLALLAPGMLQWSIQRIAFGPVGGRVFAGLYLLAIVALIRSYVADAALAYVAPLDPAGPEIARVLSGVAVARNVMLALALALAAGIGLLITRTVTAPLGQLRRGIEAARTGARRVQVPVVGHDELAEVADAFNRLTAANADATEALERQTALYQTLERAQSDLGEGVIIYDDDRFHRWNDAFLRITGFAAGEIATLAPAALVAPAARADFVERERASAGEPHQTFVAIHRSDGSLVELELAVTPMPYGTGRRIAIVRDVTERTRAERALEELALHDQLTGLANRALFREQLERTIRAASRAGDTFTLLYMDLDRFKEVNDAYGHAAGDMLLRELGARLRLLVAEVDTVARFGGDEFAILLPRCADVGGGVVTAESIANVLRAPFAVEGHQVYASASIGIVRHPEHGADADTLLRHADVAMYNAKRAGVDHSVYAIDQDPRSQERLDLMADLRHAIERDELLLHFQPQIRIATGECVAAEALVRWRHPRRGLVPPAAFIPIAEETGIINAISDWVLREALRACREWRRAGSTASVAVNFSMRTLRDPHLLELVSSTIESVDAHPSALTVELTESVMMSDPRRTLETLRGLAGMGVGVSIDDFGTGYSSLAYLQRMPVRELKIDLSFVRQLLVDPGSEAIVRSTIELGHALGLRVVGEGVEDAATLAFLAERRCDLAQGFYIARPMPEADLRAWLRDRESARIPALATT